jgi:hypothetical protein
MEKGKRVAWVWFPSSFFDYFFNSYWIKAIPQGKDFDFPLIDLENMDQRMI